uniref:Uncharacterized protein n=1 Tax=Meloidogyne incognita TaxID=6306 RepID=A0A914LUQ8_MELIC
MAKENDPFKCLRCVSIAIYCFIQFGLLGWQVQVVKEWQWHWENRELPATGAIDQYQARFPGLYARYTETPETRKINALYAIVLICLGLTIIHLPNSIAMLYGCNKSFPNWIFPWFFTSIPLIILCTVYSVLWWSGDIFAEQLTFSVFEFIISLATNGIGVVLVFLYYQRLRGKLLSERTDNGYKLPSINQNNISSTRRSRIKNKRKLKNDLNFEEKQQLPPWIKSLPNKPPKAIERKLRRKERKEMELGRRYETKRRKNNLLHSLNQINNLHFHMQIYFDLFLYKRSPDVIIQFSFLILFLLFTFCLYFDP